MPAAVRFPESPPPPDLLAGYRQLASVLGVVLAERGIDEVLTRIAETLGGLVAAWRGSVR